MKASHNSATGERPSNIWAKLFGFVAKCQDKTISEQYDAGVRLFDIRVRCIQYKLVCCHGLATYDKTLWDVCEELMRKNDPSIWVMVTYEGELTEQQASQFVYLAEFVKMYKLNVGHISVKKPVWKILKASNQPAYAQNYTKIVGWKVLLPFPRLWYWIRRLSGGVDEAGLLSMEDFV